MKGKHPWWSFWAAWIAVNAVGWFGFNLVIITPVVGHSGDRLWMPWSSALILGILQWAVLNIWFDVDYTWALAGMGAYGSMYYAASMASPDLNRVLFQNAGVSAIHEPGTMLSLQCVVLLAAGWFQYAVLRQYSRRGWFWVVLSALAAWFAEATALYSIGAHDLAAFWAMTGFIYGIVTGAGLLAILTGRQPEPSAQP